MNKFVIIGVYFGNFPPWYKLWEKSALQNNKVDFIIFTDNNVVNRENLHYVNFTLDEFNKLASKKLGLNINVKQPYKLCDFKVVYGKIFIEYLLQYEYWAHCDFDMIFGNLNKFLMKYDIYKYDKFLPLGHLSFYRNTTNVNNYYSRYKSNTNSFKNILTSDMFFAFDEIGMVSFYKDNKIPFFEQRIFAEINQRYHRFKLNKKDKNFKHQVFYYENGKVLKAYQSEGEIKVEEYMYIHFQNRNLKVNGKLKDSYYVTPKGFISKNKGVPNLREINKYNKYHGLLFEMTEITIYNIRKWIREIHHLFVKYKNNERFNKVK